MKVSGSTFMLKNENIWNIFMLNLITCRNHSNTLLQGGQIYFKSVRLKIPLSSAVSICFSFSFYGLQLYIILKTRLTEF
jgi:hypothetical protein